jgi:hypothetical protein
VGIVSINDITRLAAHVAKGHPERELVRTLAAIGRPRAGANLVGNGVAAA